ncbi:EAL domain-containing protein [Paraburkholderia sp. B3]|uniref:EAL domain-containing protein n=1 Tax=Paraburkholderia sp. B3 TaxID=3134791 RepID=UPI0039828774
MKPGARRLVAGLLCCLCAICYADDEAAFSSLVPSGTRIASSEVPESAAFPGHGCTEAGAFLLPARFGDAGMNEFVHVDGPRETCAFHTRSLDTSRAALADTREEQRAAGTAQTQGDEPEENRSSAPLATTNPLPHDAARRTANIVAAPKPAEPLSVMSAACYRWILGVLLLVLVLALLALVGAATALLYVRWFSERAILARAVNRGLKRDEFRLEHQPVFYTRTRKCIGLEAVLRWKNVAYGLRGEAWFMNELADRRAATKIVAFMLSTAERELSLLAEGRNLYLMVNVWASCLGNEECLSLIATRARSFTSSRLVFQIKAEDLPARLGSVMRLRRDKVRTALSGVRTPTAIIGSALPAGFEFIKVDRDIMALDESARLQTLQAIAAVGRQHDVAVIADGVEGIGQNHDLGRAGIELAQGFFFGKAISADQLPRFFEKLDWWQGKHAPAASTAHPT